MFSIEVPFQFCFLSGEEQGPFDGILMTWYIFKQDIIIFFQFDDSEIFIKCIIVWEVCIVGVILCLEAKELVSCRDSPSSSSLSLTSATVASIATAIATVASIAFVVASCFPGTLWTQAMSQHHVKPNQPQSTKIGIRNVIVYLSNLVDWGWFGLTWCWHLAYAHLLQHIQCSLLIFIIFIIFSNRLSFNFSSICHCKCSNARPRSCCASAATWEK